jgi:hypothetical protein
VGAAWPPRSTRDWRPGRGDEPAGHADADEGNPDRASGEQAVSWNAKRKQRQRKVDSKAQRKGANPQETKNMKWQRLR